MRIEKTQGLIAAPFVPYLFYYCALHFFSSHSRAETLAERPNILLIVSEDNGDPLTMREMVAGEAKDGKFGKCVKDGKGETYKSFVMAKFVFLR